MTGKYMRIISHKRTISLCTNCAPLSRTRPFQQTSNFNITLPKRYQTTTIGTTNTDTNDVNNSSTMATNSTNTDTTPALELNNDESILSEITEFADYQLSQRKSVGGRGSFQAIEISEQEMELARAHAGLLDGSQFWSIHDFWYAKLLPVKTTQFLMDWANDYMPYWTVLIALPFLAKICLVMPTMVKSNKSLEQNMPYMASAMKDLHIARQEYGMTDRVKYSQETSKIMAKYGFNPFVQQLKLFVPVLIQTPVHLTCYVAVNTMYPKYANWKVGGTLWFEDLTMPDASYMLPAMCGLSMIMSALVVARRSGPIAARFQTLPPKAIGVAGCVASCVFVPIAAQFSAAFNLYLMSNITSFLMQSMVLEHPKFREFVGMKPASFSAYHQAEIARVSKEVKKQTKKEKEIGSHKKKGRRVTSSKTYNV